MAKTTEANTGRTLDEEIEALDREAREALDKLADRRAELQRKHQATELAAERQREREQERRLEEEREAQERAQQKAVEKAERLGSERLALEERAEEEAKALAATIGELIELDPVHRRAVEAASEAGSAPEQLFGRTFSEELRDWFGGRFKAVVPGMRGRPARGPLAAGARRAHGSLTGVAGAVRAFPFRWSCAFPRPLRRSSSGAPLLALPRFGP